MTTRQKSYNTREIAAVLAEKILDQGEYSHILLRRTLDSYPDMEKRDKAFLTRMVTGTVERCLFLDYAINQLSKTRVDKMKPLIRAVLRISAYQIFFMDAVEDRAACSEAVKLVKKRGFQNLSGFVNGVLRNLSRQKEALLDLSSVKDKTKALSLTYSVPEWMIRQWDKMFPQTDTEVILKGILKEPPLSVRINTSLASPGQVQESLSAQGAVGEPGPWFSDNFILEGFDRLDELICFQKGWIQVQDTSSQLVGHLAAPKKGSMVIDVCAAPGGKTMHMADLLAGTGMVYACDLSEAKVDLIRENVARAGFSNVKPLVHDALCFVPEWEEKADLVIADLPCSGLGIMGRKPDIRYRIDMKQVQALKKLQREILTVVSRYVKPGGYLMYSTCTITREENTENVKWIQQALPFEAEDFQALLPEGLKTDTARQGYVQLLPGIHESDGFFISRFRKTGAKQQ